MSGLTAGTPYHMAPTGTQGDPLPPKMLVALKGRPCLWPQGLLRPSLHNANTSVSSLPSDQYGNSVLPHSLEHLGLGTDIPCANGTSLVTWPSIIVHSPSSCWL